MSLSIGIVGLPNVGKSTLFNALTGSKQADAQNYPFCTIDPNIGIVEVPDFRLEKLSEVSKSKKIIPAAVKFVDIAGLVKGAAKGEGLGNKFLSHIREVNAIAQVVRGFSDPNVTHVHNKIDPREDAEVVNLELCLADLETTKKRLDNTKKIAKGDFAKEIKKEIELLERVVKSLEQGRPVRGLDYDEEELLVMRDLNLLTMKPMLYIINIDEKAKQDVSVVIPNPQHRGEESLSQSPTDRYPSPRIAGASLGMTTENDPQIAICAKLEAEVAELSKEEAKEYLSSLGIEQTGLDKLIVAGYKSLDLITYFTSGEPETRAWTVKRNTKAPDAAGVIHTDFVKGFIKADVIGWEDFARFGGWSKTKETGKLRLEGKDYIVKDGDVCYFHVNA